jgi:hypothetical protein
LFAVDGFLQSGSGRRSACRTEKRQQTESLKIRRLVPRELGQMVQQLQLDLETSIQNRIHVYAKQATVHITKGLKNIIILHYFMDLKVEF